MWRLPDTDPARGAMERQSAAAYALRSRADQLPGRGAVTAAQFLFQSSRVTAYNAVNVMRQLWVMNNDLLSTR